MGRGSVARAPLGGCCPVQVKVGVPRSRVLSGRAGEERLHSGPVLKVEQSGFTAGLDVQHKGMKEVKDDSFCHLGERVSG